MGEFRKMVRYRKETVTTGDSWIIDNDVDLRSTRHQQNYLKILRCEVSSGGEHTKDS